MKLIAHENEGSYSILRCCELSLECVKIFKGNEVVLYISLFANKCLFLILVLRLERKAVCHAERLLTVTTGFTCLLPTSSFHNHGLLLLDQQCIFK